MILAEILDSNPQSFISKPSSIAVLVIGGGCCFFLLWAMSKASKVADAQGEGMGCAFGIQGFVCLVILVAIAVVFMTIFQAGHPGQ